MYVPRPTQVTSYQGGLGVDSEEAEWRDAGERVQWSGLVLMSGWRGEGRRSCR